MASFALAGSTSEASSRQVLLKLNTIMEDEYSLQGDPDEEGRGRSRSPSSRSQPSSPIPLSASTISSYYRKSRLSRDFDDLYDVSESETDQESIDLLDRSRKRDSSASDCSLKRSSCNGRRRNRYPSLCIPSPRLWPTIEKFRKENAIPPTPPAKIPISPDILSRLNTNASLPSTPPSLDGSLTSDQLAASSAPPTPSEFSSSENVKNWGQLHVARSMSDLALEDAGVVIEVPEEDQKRDSGGIKLSADALDVLQHLSLDTTFEPPSAASDEEQEEMQEVPFKLQRSPSMEFEPKSATSEYSIAQLSVPSPGGFFSSLDEDAQQAWFTLSIPPQVNNDVPPSSTTAEHFYNTPWNNEPSTAPQPPTNSSGSNAEGLQMAVFVPLSPIPLAGTDPSRPSIPSDSGWSRTSAVNSIEILDILDKELKLSTDTVFDRTTDWLAAQNSYMSALRETNPANKASDVQSPGRHNSHNESFDSGLKRVVRFLDTDVAKAAEQSDVSPTAIKTDPLFYHAFQYMSSASSPTDSFVHRQSRFDAIQAQRTSFQASHLESLLGHYETSTTDRPNPSRPISMMPGKSKEAEQETAEKQLIAQVDRERQALEQVAPAMWVIEALRFLSNGKLFNSPVSVILGRARPLESTTLPDHVRVLDLGGQPQCDWAWHFAQDFPNVKTYTATSSSGINDTIRGPSNHRLAQVDNLWTLPFPANHFDAVSARSLPTFLRTKKPIGNDMDEYDLCLRECMRVLKPGGYIEFFVLDAEIIGSSSSDDGGGGGGPGGGTSSRGKKAGPLADAASVEFGFKLHQYGYDSVPSKSFLARVRRAGYVDIKRAWMFLPMGTANGSGSGGGLAPMPETPPPHASIYEDQIALHRVEAVQGPVGSTADAASVTGLLGGWLWEQWLLKLQLEMGKYKNPKLIDGVAAVVEEGKRTGAGFRVLRGWARKGM